MEEKKTERVIKEVYIDNNNSKRIGSDEFYEQNKIIENFVGLFFGELYNDPTPNNPVMSSMVIKMLNMLDCLGKELYNKENGEVKEDE